MPDTLFQDHLGDYLKSVQIAFYSVGSLMAVLTYRAAKRGLLNSVNTEYQKRVMDRLQKLSDDLYSEFDTSSDLWWGKNDFVREALTRINEDFTAHKSVILDHGDFPGVPVTEDTLRLERMLGAVRADPFIPERIRTSVLDLLENRVAVLHTTHLEVLEAYMEDLAKGRREPATDPLGMGGIHNRIVDALYKKGCGVSQIHEEVNEIRLQIQDYFDSFDPHRSWWQRRERKFYKKALPSEESDPDEAGTE